MTRRVLGLLCVHLLLAGCAQLGLRVETEPVAAVMISESRAGGQSAAAYQETAGTWLDSTGKSTAEGCSLEIGSRFVDIASGPSGARAQWTLVPGESGSHDVQVTWPRSGNANNVTYTVTSGDETSRQTQSHVLTQNGWGGGEAGNANEWITLATVEAQAGEPIVIEISDEAVSGGPDTINAARMYADAARLVKR